MLKRSSPDPSPLSGGPETPLRILIASYRSHPHVGGQGVYVRELSQALADLGHEVSVASGPPYPHLDPRVRLVRLPSLDLFAEKNAALALRPHHLKSWADISEYFAHNTGAFGEMHAFALRLKRYLAANPGRYDVVHDNQTFARPLLSIAQDMPLVATLHHPITRDLQLALDRAEGPFSRLLLKRWHGFVRTQGQVARDLPRLLTVSQASKQAAITDFGLRPEQIHVAFNGVDHDLFRPDPAVKKESGLIVTAASADTPLKGLEYLIRAFARIADDQPQARLTVIGRLREGPAKTAMEAAGLQDRVSFVSGLETAEVADLYRRAEIVAAPSLFEGFGFPAAEAMACGTAVLASTGGALPEIVGPNGLVTPAGDSGALAAALKRLLTDKPLRDRLARQGRERALAQFQWRSHAEAALSLYRDALVDVDAVA